MLVMECGRAASLVFLTLAVVLPTHDYSVKHFTHTSQLGSTYLFNISVDSKGRSQLASVCETFDMSSHSGIFITIVATFKEGGGFNTRTM